MCEALDVSVAGFYAWAARTPSEAEQQRCKSDETAIGATAHAWASAAAQKIFGSNRKRAGLTYAIALSELEGGGDTVAKSSA